MSEAEFWIIVRRALIMICSAIEKKYMQKDGMPIASEKE